MTACYGFELKGITDQTRNKGRNTKTLGRFKNPDYRVEVRAVVVVKALL